MPPAVQTLPVERSSEGFLRSRITTHSQITSLNTSGDLESELWVCLEYYSEVDDVLDNYLKARGYRHATTRRVAREQFRAYIRQAKNYYYAAKPLSARSSGLLYYYAFLNLVKAGLIVHDTSLLAKKFLHGQRPVGERSRNLASHYQRIAGRRSPQKVYVLPKFYELYFGKVIKNQDLNILRLLSYCSDVGYQYETITHKQSSLVPGYFSIRINRETQQSWALLALVDFKKIESNRKTLKKFNETFEEVSVSNAVYNQIFGISAGPAIDRYRFFQGRNEHGLLPDGRIIYNPPIWDLTDALKGFIQDNYYQSGFDFFLTVPYAHSNQIPMNEIFAIYITMHHISELVRYNPSFMESLLSSKEAWLLDGFIQSSPSTFLRGIIAWITGINYLMESR